MLNEKKLTKSELDKREDIIMKMKKNKRSLVQKYGKDAEQVMYGRATNMAKKQAESMNNDRLKEMIKDALKNPSQADLNKDGKLSDYEETRGAAIEKAIVKEWGGSDQFALIKSMHRDLGEPTEFPGLTQIMYAAEDATDFYMDDFEEYTTDKDSLILANARSYARKHFPEFMEMAANMVAPSNINRFNEVAGLNLNTTRDEEGGVEISDPDADEAGILDTEAGLGLEEGASSEEKRIAMSAVKRLAKYRGVSNSEARQDLIRAAKEVGDLKENFNQVDSQFEDLSQVVKNIANVGEMSIEDAAMGAIDHIGEKFNVDLDFGRMNEDLDLGHEDNEPGMLKSDLYRIGKYAMDLYQMMDEFEAGSEEVDFPHWWQSKIINAKTALVGAKHYLDFEVKEPAIDALVDKMDDIAPEMEIDVVDDIEEVDNFNPKKTDDPQLDRFRAKGQLEGNLDPNETASLEPEGRFWIVTYRTMDGKQKKSFQSEDEARKFYNTLDEGLPKGYWDKKMDAKDEVDESYNTLVNKIKKQGQSEKSAKAIAGAVASYKAKGGGKGPTAKQKG